MSADYETVILCAIVITFSLIVLRIYQKKTNEMCKSPKRLNGKTVIVTGGTTGMGLEMAIDFARRGAKVIIACPFEDEGIRAKQQIVERTDNFKVIFKYLDLSSLDSVRSFARDILKAEDRLDILMNNAGVLTPGDYLTSDGMNFIMQVNYFGQFLLTLLLLPLLKKTGTPLEPSRIVNMSSVLHNVGKIDIENMNKVGYWYQWKLYCNSKLCMTAFTRELSIKLKDHNVVVNSVDPGAVGTGIYVTYGRIISLLIRTTFAALFKNPWEGAQTALYVALDSEAGNTNGMLYKNCKLCRAKSVVYNQRITNRLFEESLKIVQLDDFEY